MSNAHRPTRCSCDTCVDAAIARVTARTAEWAATDPAGYAATMAARIADDRDQMAADRRIEGAE